MEKHPAYVHAYLQHKMKNAEWVHIKKKKFKKCIIKNMFGL